MELITSINQFHMVDLLFVNYLSSNFIISIPAKCFNPQSPKKLQEKRTPKCSQISKNGIDAGTASAESCSSFGYWVFKICLKIALPSTGGRSAMFGLAYLVVNAIFKWLLSDNYLHITSLIHITILIVDERLFINFSRCKVIHFCQ